MSRERLVDFVTIEGRLREITLEAYAGDYRRDISKARARRLISKLTAEECEEALVKIIMEVANGLRSTDRLRREREASEAGERARAEEEAREKEERSERLEREERARREEEDRVIDPLIRAFDEARTPEEVERALAGLNDSKELRDRWGDRWPARSFRGIAEREGRLPQTWRTKPFDEFTEDEVEMMSRVKYTERAQTEDEEWGRDRYSTFHMWRYQRSIEEGVHDQAMEGARQKFVEWTTELLGAAFRLADGTITTWGEATEEQHLERVKMFERQAVTGVMGASRHLQAVEEIRAHGARNLAEAVAVPA